MQIKSVNPKDVSTNIAHSLGIILKNQNNMLGLIIPQALRRAAYILSPCTANELERAVKESLENLSINFSKEIADLVHAGLEELLNYGEIFEMQIMNNEYWNTSPFVLRPAPPSFVRRYDGSIIILGVAGDDITPLTSDISEKLIYHGALRILPACESKGIPSLMESMGLIELSEKVWLRLPSIESPEQFLNAYRQALSELPSNPINIDDLAVLSSARQAHFYKDRWIKINDKLTGIYVARRPQRYGSPIWCIAQITSGILEKFVDLVSPADRERPCDLAWRIQMALDAERGEPQKFSIQRPSLSAQRIDFYSPLPSWAQRALCVAGERVTPENALLSFNLEKGIAPEKIKTLQDLLWLENTQKY